jgi:hypothetical protein
MAFSAVFSRGNRESAEIKNSPDERGRGRTRNGREKRGNKSVGSYGL